MDHKVTLVLHKPLVDIPWKWKPVDEKIMNNPAILKWLASIAAGVLGISGNSWIVYVNMKDWRQGFHLSLIDQIISFMALINAMMQNMFSFDNFSIAIGFYNGFDQIHLKIIGIIMILVSCNIWLTAWLSIYYYLRIVNFTGGFLLVLKMRISKILPKLLVLSMVESFIIALPSFWNIYTKIDKEIIGNASHNFTKDNVSLIMSSPYLITAFLGCIVPLILTLLPIGLTLSSLWRHVKMMKMNKSDSFHPQTQAHITAARTMVLLVTLHTGFHAVSIYVLRGSFNFVDTTMLCCGYFLMLYPTIEAFVIITGNSKLKKALKSLLRLVGI